MPHGLSVFPPSCRLSRECPRPSHPSFRRAPPRSSFASNTARSLSTRAHLPGVSALITTSPTCVHSYAEHPTLSFVPSSGSLNLSTFYSASWLASLLRLAAVFRTHPVQGLLSSCSRASSSEAVTPLSLAACRSLVAQCPRTSTPRLRGFDPQEDAFHKPSS